MLRVAKSHTAPARENLTGCGGAVSTSAAQTPVPALPLFGVIVLAVMLAVGAVRRRV